MRFGNPSKKSRIVSSTKGHHIEFPGKGSVPKDNVPAAAVLAADGICFMYVPPAVHPEVIAAGMLPESEMEEAEAPKGAVKPTDPEKLREEAFEAFEILVAAGDRESFSGNGMPKAPAVEKLLGYVLTNTEIKDTWGKFQLARADK